MLESHLVDCESGSADHEATIVMAVRSEDLTRVLAARYAKSK